ncbi:d-aspartate oxidase [Trichonephila clavata]|uniref:D-aspartate oxidase n=1 Tax=Trichonephila clavata TaxID=2740835 RepID=A0A8X6G7H3_TRICU|nr:d-aspartate oxidase [Trichonephila clavata]
MVTPLIYCKEAQCYYHINLKGPSPLPEPSLEIFRTFFVIIVDVGCIFTEGKVGAIMVFKVAVIGGGVVGITSAVVIAENLPDVEVTVISDKWSPDTTGDGSAGFWCPYLLGDVPPEVLREWCQISFQTFHDIYKSPLAVEYGVGLFSVYYLYSTPEEIPDYHDVYLHHRPLTKKELSLFPRRFQYGFFLTTFFAECSKFLPALMKRIQKKGGRIIEKKVESLSELAGKYDAVINCSGIGARTLVPDPEVIPVRGQVMRVHAPWIKHGVIADNDYYVLPNADEIILGGTHQEGDWNTQVDPVDRRNIWEGCVELLPCLKDATILRDWVGLRPYRSTPRIDREVLNTEKGEIKVIHNYGHGGCGVTLSWGCAHYVLRLLRETLEISSHL